MLPGGGGLKRLTHISGAAAVAVALHKKFTVINSVIKVRTKDSPPLMYVRRLSPKQPMHIPRAVRPKIKRNGVKICGMTEK